MSARIIDGKEVAARVKRQVAETAAMLSADGRVPKLVAIQVGHSPASELYLRMQASNCAQVGVDHDVLELPADMTHAELERRVEQIDRDDSVSAVIVQMPLPEHLDPREVQKLIPPAKDAEAISPANMGKLFYDDYAIAPCTALAAIAILKTACDDLAGKEIVIVGHSEIFGKPLAAMLLADRSKAPTVTVCHVATRELARHTSQADVLIVATGASQKRWLTYKALRAGGETVELPDLSPLIRAEHVGEGAIVIDVAINRIPRALGADGLATRGEDGREQMVTVGDVDFAAALAKAGAITPVPGGVGPATVAMLLLNVVTCAAIARG
jgi:methylenetetrahydrofolate dehydrogenase (NADP+)/methenyltetrahydrofolate cyclohydrolase